MTRPSQEPARAEIHAAIRRIAVAARASLIRRPVFPGSPHLGTVEEPEPLAGLAAAAQLRGAATVAVADYARTARATGASWEQVGSALGYPGRGDLSHAGSAFRDLAWSSGSSPSPTFRWTCSTCREFVVDHGPEISDPAEAEEGHDAACTRLAAAVAAFNARRGDS